MFQENKLIKESLLVSAFLSEAGWLPDAGELLTACLKRLSNYEDTDSRTKALECCLRYTFLNIGIIFYANFELFFIKLCYI